MKTHSIDRSQTQQLNAKQMRNEKFEILSTKSVVDAVVVGANLRFGKKNLKINAYE